MRIAAPYRLTFAAQGDLFDAARALEAEHQVDAESFAAYDSSSIFLTITDAAGRMLGAVRVIQPGPAGLKTLSDPRTEQAARPFGGDAGRSWDIASFTVRPGTEGRVAAALCHGIVQALRTHRVRAVVATLDDAARATFAAAGLLPGRVPGADVAVRCGRVSELLDMQRRTNQDGYRLVSQGLGLEGVQVPSSDDLLLTAPMRAGVAWARVRELQPTG